MENNRAYLLHTEITKSHLNNRICQHCGVKTSTVTPSFYYVFNISLSCNISIPSFIGNLWWVLLLGNHLKPFIVVYAYLVPFLICMLFNPETLSMSNKSFLFFIKIKRIQKIKNKPIFENQLTFLITFSAHETVETRSLYHLGFLSKFPTTTRPIYMIDPYGTILEWASARLHQKERNNQLWAKIHWYLCMSDLGFMILPDQTERALKLVLQRGSSVDYPLTLWTTPRTTPYHQWTTPTDYPKLINKICFNGEKRHKNSTCSTYTIITMKKAAIFISLTSST